MPIYEEEGRLTREDLLDLRKRNKCQQCGGMLNVFLDFDADKAFLACNDWHRTHHEGIEREPSRYEKEGLASLNIPTRREIMVGEYGPEKTQALDRYIGTAAITKRIATEIVETLWGEAPAIEKTKAILLCQTYQLNPLMKHIYLIGYKRRDKAGKYMVEDGEFVMDWSIQIGIGATRLMAQRKHNYSYLDMTPRKATQEEIDKILGDTADPNSIYGFVHIKDIATGAEAFGLRGIPKNERIKGEEKGNTHLNMACVRAERLALDRQYPGEMPQGVEVVDERYIEAEYHLVTEPPPSKQGGEKIGESAGEEKGGVGKPGTTSFSPPKQETQNFAGMPPVQPEGEGFSINLEWLGESQKVLKWSDDTCKTFLISKYKVSPQGTLLDVLSRLTREQAEDFSEEIQQRVSQKQAQLL